MGPTVGWRNWYVLNFGWTDPGFMVLKKFFGFIQFFGFYLQIRGSSLILTVLRLGNRHLLYICDKNAWSLKFAGVLFTSHEENSQTLRISPPAPPLSIPLLWYPPFRLDFWDVIASKCFTIFAISAAVKHCWVHAMSARIHGALLNLVSVGFGTKLENRDFCAQTM
jgi:hypothetical protein